MEQPGGRRVLAAVRNFQPIGEKFLREVSFITMLQH